MREPIVWLRCETAGKNLMGTDFSVNGSPVISSAKFKNGFTSSDTDYIYTTNSTLIDALRDKGTLECWIKHTNDISSSATDWKQFWAFEGSSSYQCRLGKWSNQSKVAVYWNSNHYMYSYRILENCNEWVNGALVHYAVAWDKDGIDGGSDTLKLFIDGVARGSSSAAIGSMTGAISRLNIGVYLTGNLISSQSIFDNVKIYDYAKTDFSDRFNERGGLNDQIMSI